MKLPFFYEVTIVDDDCCPNEETVGFYTNYDKALSEARKEHGNGLGTMLTSIVKWKMSGEEYVVDTYWERKRGSDEYTAKEISPLD